MRVLVISHSAIQPTYHRKFEEVCKAADDELVIRIIVPDKWHENDQLLEFSSREVDNNLYFVSAETAFPGYGSRFYFKSGIVRHFRDFNPHIIHMEEEPWGICALQTVVLRKLYCPDSKFIFRTSLSIPIKLKFNFLASIIEKMTFSQCHHAFILSNKAGEILREKGYQKDMSVSPNGVDTQIFKKMDSGQLRQKFDIDKTCFVIGYVGRLLEMKGLSTLIKAFSMLEHDNLKLLLVGSGDYKDEMLKIAGDLGMSHNLIFTDSVPAEDVPKYISCMDVLVLPSITTSGWVEFFGRVLVEAMVCHVPVIGSSSGEIPNVVGDAGLIFHEGDERDLKDKLNMIITDVDLRQSLIEKGYDRATSLFTWESIGKDTYTVYKKLMEC